MFRAVATFVLCLALAAPAAGWTQENGRLTAVKPNAAALALRGPVTPEPLTAQAGRPAAAQSPDPVAPQADAADPLALLAPPPGAPALDVGQCRQACARGYYFCLSADVAADCVTRWSQCRSDCGAPR